MEAFQLGELYAPSAKSHGLAVWQLEPGERMYIGIMFLSDEFCPWIWFLFSLRCEV